MRHTKIVATLGPASNTPEQIENLIRAGVNVVRLNFSHGTHEEHARLITLVRDIAKTQNRAVGILMDLQGPKMRTGALADGEPIQLDAGQKLTITTNDVVGNAERISTTYELLPADVHVNSKILLSDGLIELCVLKTTGTDVLCEVIHGGTLREHQGINLPGTAVSAPAVTKKDVDDLHFGLEQGIDFVAISFVRQANDVRRVKDRVAQAGKDVPVIAKIERPEAVDVLADILDVADGVMVARGDLGVEMPTERVPIIQKQIIEAANCKGIPVITATQMLESMIRNPRPTRAEVTDVANAIIDGTDAVMLSGETAAGAYPLEAVQMMALIAETTEMSGRYNEGNLIRPIGSPDLPLAPLAIGTAASAIVSSLPIKAIVVFTLSGYTARLVSQQRPQVPVLAFTHEPHIYRRLSLLWAIAPVLSDLTESLEQFEQMIQTELITRGLAAKGDAVVMTGGYPIVQHGLTNFLKIVEIVEA